MFRLPEGIHDGFLDSRWVLGFTMGSWIPGTLVSKISEFLDLLESIIGFNKSFVQWAGIEVKNKKLMPISNDSSYF